MMEGGALSVISCCHHRKLKNSFFNELYFDCRTYNQLIVEYCLTVNIFKNTTIMSSNKAGVPNGVIYGEDVRKLFQHAQDNQYAIPAINVTSSSTVVAALEAGESP
jgi:hypothetical protein